MRYGIDLNGKDKFFNQGVELVNQNKHKEAILKFEKSLKKNPKHIPTYINIGYLHFVLRQYDQTVKTLNLAIEKGIESSEIWHYKGYALKLLNKFEDAIESLNYSIKFDPEDCDTLLLLANNHKILKNYDDALKYYDDALLINPYYDLVRKNKLTILKELERDDEIKKFREDSAMLYFVKGLEHQKNEKYLASAITFRKSINFNNNAPALGSLENVLDDIYKNPKLISKFGFEAYDYNNWRNKGLVFLDMGNLKKLTMGELQIRLKEFVILNEIPLENFTMIFFDVMGIEKTLLGIEIIPGVFNKFNSIYMMPYTVLQPNSYQLATYGPSQTGSMKELVDEYGIKEIKLSIWHDSTLTFYELGSTTMKLTEMYERSYLFTKHLKVNLSLIKMFPLKDILVLAVEQFSGAYDAFQQKTGLEPITLVKNSKK